MIRGSHQYRQESMKDKQAVQMARAEQVRTRQRGPEKRQLILSAARTLVAQVGFRETQMSGVAELAGIAIGTLYRYFPSKNELMVETVAAVAQREVDVVAGVAMSDGSAQDRLGVAAWTFASRALRGRRLAHALVAEPVDPEIEAARLKYRRALARVFETIIDQGIRDKEFIHQHVPAAAACMVGCLFEGLVGPLGFDNVVTEAERREFAVAIVRFCLRGVAARELSFEPSGTESASA
jgi:AcrR family transcriptional regulator